MLFKIRDLTKVYGHRTVLDIPELDFERGIVYSLLGPNGSGKTTLLEILGLLMPPTSGKIHYKGSDINFGRSNLTSLRREIVMVQQNPVLFTTTVYRNVEFGLKVRRIPKKKRRSIIEKSLDSVDMRPFMGADARKLSGGEAQRVAIAMALACSPEVIFLDETMTSVDMENRFAIERILTEINEQRKISVIFTTHDLFQASQLSHNVISLSEGRPVPTPSENIFRGRIVKEENGKQFCLTQGRIKFFVKTGKREAIKISIDPQKIRVSAGEDISPKENAFKGRLLQLSWEHNRVRGIADIGIPLNFYLPRDEVKSKHLCVGDTVTIVCPRTSIHLFEP
jgi:tungstate transport system ATP-binding protein